MKPNFTLNQRFVDHLIQAILIFASVFLAFWMNEYRISKSEEQETNEALESILSETENNLQILERWTPYHLELVKKSNSLTERQIDSIGNFDLGFIIESEKGIFREVLTNDAWNYLNQSNIKVEIEKKLLIAKIYEQQKYVENALKDILEFLKERETFRDSFAKENFMIFGKLIAELYGQEIAMIDSYKRAIQELNSKK
ncbi:MAG: hypothetical protein DWQ06_04510 [Calditrichaeota bacterium]|nr:MAG: hypothetical protein DWQ06_04510 [Calditrichota bacterium]